MDEILHHLEECDGCERDITSELIAAIYNERGGEGGE